MGFDGYFVFKEISNEVFFGYVCVFIRGWVIEDCNEFFFRVVLYYLVELFWRGMEEVKELDRVGLMVGILFMGIDGLVRRLLEWNFEIRGEGVVGFEEK